MKYLESHEHFEQLIGRSSSTEPYDVLPPITIIWFSAEWCGPCKRIGINQLTSEFDVNWLKCDVDMNNYTAGYCGIRTIPTFMVIHNKKILGSNGSASTIEILEWLRTLIPK
jgi:thioredoxin-like negative regulator of GroEL